MEAKYDFNGKILEEKFNFLIQYLVWTNNHAVYLDVKQYLANQRQGTNKERAEVAGSTRKIKNKKGTGTARAGSAKNPLFKVVEQFSDQDQEVIHSNWINLKRLARKSAFSIKAKESNIIVLEDFNFETQTLKISLTFESFRVRK
jgi:large subunit ribosomal protein L4